MTLEAGFWLWGGCAEGVGGGRGAVVGRMVAYPSLLMVFRSLPPIPLTEQRLFMCIFVHTSDFAHCSF